MVRTKKHFRPPSPTLSSSSSSSEEEPEPQHVLQRGRGKQLGGAPPSFGRGKQLSMAAPAAPAGGRGRGKELRPPADSESSDDSSSEEEAPPPPPIVSRGKQLRPAPPRPPAGGGGKQLRAPSPAAAEEEEESDSSDEEAEAAPPPPAPAFRGRGGGKMLMRPAEPVEEDSSSSSSEEEPWAAPPQRGQGKQLRPPPAATSEKEESDMEESSSSEEEEEPPPPPEAPPSPPPSPPPAPEAEASAAEASDASSSESAAASPPRRPTRAAAAKAAAAVAREASSSSSSDEEAKFDEDAAAPGGDAGAAADADADADSSDEEQEWDMETFDMRRLVTDGADRKYLDSLNELEREHILAERFEARKQEADMKKALRENKRREREQQEAAGGPPKTSPRKRPPAKAKKAAPAKKKRPAKKVVESEEESGEEESEEEEDDDDDENYAEGEDNPDTSGDLGLAHDLAGRRVSGRNMVKKGKQFKKKAALAKIRENRAHKQAAADEPDSDDDYGGDSDDSDSEYEDDNMIKPWQKKGKKAARDVSSDEDGSGTDEARRADAEGPGGRRRAEDAEAALEDYTKLTIPRRRLMRWCNEPFFERAVQDFYVRLGIGRDKKTQKACYRLCRITGIATKGEYGFPRVDGRKPVSTNKWLQVSFGQNEKEFKMIMVSESRPSEDDYTQLVSQLKTERLSDHMLTKKAANKLRRGQDELVNNYTYTKADIDKLVEDKKKRNHKSLNIGMENSRVDISVQGAKDEVEEAKRRLEDAKVEQMEADDDMAGTAENAVRKAQDTLQTAQRKLKGKMEEQEKIHQEDRERKNRLKKSTRVQNWTKVNRKARLANQNADFQSYKEQQERGLSLKADPYARRRQQPKNLWEVGGAPTPDRAPEGGAEEEKKEAAPAERADADAGGDGERERRAPEAAPPPGPDPSAPPRGAYGAYDDDALMGDAAGLGGGGGAPARTRVRKGISLEDYQGRKAAGTL